MIIAFYGVDGGSAATTSNLLGTALMSHFHYQRKVLMASLCNGLNGLETAFDCEKRSFRIAEEVEYFYHEGMDYVLKEADFGNIHPRVIQRGARELFSQKVFYLSSANGTGWKRIWKGFEEHGEAILDSMEDFAELVFLDCGLGKGNFFHKILQRADVIVVNLIQSQRIIHQFFSSFPKFFEKTVYLIGRYDQQFPCDINKVMKQCRIPKEHIGIVPYNAGFWDAFQNGRCAQFIQRNAYGGFYEKNRLFSKELKASTEMILRKAEILV